MARRNWKNKTVEDFIDYYQTNYAYMSRGEIQKADNGFYSAIIRRELLDQVFPEDKRGRDWSEFKVEDFQNHYNEHHKGMSRSEVKKADRGFYQIVQKRKLLDQVFPESKRRNWSEFELDDFIDYYQTNHLGKNRGEVEKEDLSFYSAIIRRKLQDQVFPESQHKVPSGYWKNFDNVKEPLEELIEDLGRFPKKSEIEKANSSLYHAIHKHYSYISVKNQMGYLEREKELARIFIELF